MREDPRPMKTGCPGGSGKAWCRRGGGVSAGRGGAWRREQGMRRRRELGGGECGEIVWRGRWLREDGRSGKFGGAAVRPQGRIPFPNKVKVAEADQRCPRRCRSRGGNGTFPNSGTLPSAFALRPNRHGRQLPRRLKRNEKPCSPDLSKSAGTRPGLMRRVRCLSRRPPMPPGPITPRHPGGCLRDGSLTGARRNIRKPARHDPESSAMERE